MLEPGMQDGPGNRVGELPAAKGVVVRSLRALRR